MTTPTISITIAFAIGTVLALCAATLNLRRDLTMFQQNSYRADRYRRWMDQSGESTSGWRLAAIIVFLFSATRFCTVNVYETLIALFCTANIISLASRKYKKPLAMTKRANRLMAVSLALVLIFLGIVVGATYSDPAQALFIASWLLCGVCGMSYIIVAANWILKPVEKHISGKYTADAIARLRSMPSLKIIGITGSYGKTTTKHYLHHILSQQFETLMTPGSFNTPMGVVRTIREHLKPYHEIFIVEMGAKQKGDIKEICDIAHPADGIVTAVGPQHLESFKTIENIRDTKFELIEALPAAGMALVNDDFPAIAQSKVAGHTLTRYTVQNPNDKDATYRAENIRYTSAGTEFDIVSADGLRLHLKTPVVGRCNISNILAAVAMAKHMGVDDSKIAYAVETLPQVEHRLAIKHIPGGLTIIDDAFNSNPVGSEMALEVLSSMTQGKRILITPGMIELGDRQFELNKSFGLKAADSCDTAIVVGQYNRDAIIQGLEEGNMPRHTIHAADTFAQAQQILKTISSPGDTVLYENDLPDTFK